jgi:hypothetical protein
MAAVVGPPDQFMPVAAQTTVDRDVLAERVVADAARRGVAADQRQGLQHRPMGGVVGPELQHLQQPD